MSKGKVAFVGSGMIGSGIAVNCILNGYEAVLQTRRQVEKTNNRMKSMLRILVDNKVITQAQCDEASKLYSVTTSIEEAVTGAFFIQESGPELLETKRVLFDQIEEFAAPDAIIASSTSKLLCTDMQKGAKHPERFIIGHPYHPAYLLPLIELVAGAETSPEVMAKAKAFYDGIGKETIICKKDISGYIVNRLSWAAAAEAKKTVAQGICSAEEMDKAIMYGPGLRFAITGALLTMTLGTEGGLRNEAEKYHKAPDPDIELIASSIDEEMANRPPEQGNDWDSIGEYRDKMIIAFLRAQGKL